MQKNTEGEIVYGGSMKKLLKVVVSHCLICLSISNLLIIPRTSSIYHLSATLDLETDREREMRDKEISATCYYISVFIQVLQCSKYFFKHNA